MSSYFIKEIKARVYKNPGFFYCSITLVKKPVMFISIFIFKAEFKVMMLSKKYLLLIAYCFFVLSACETDMEITLNETQPGFTSLEPDEQRQGDPVTGKAYLLNGNYIGSGIPYDSYKSVFGDNNDNVLNRVSDNATIAPSFTAFIHSNGSKIVSPNCLQCHGSFLNGEYIIGLGNINADFTEDQSTLVDLVDVVIENTYGRNSKEWEAYEQFSTTTRAIAPYTKTEVVGANPADQLFAAIASFRDKLTLQWQQTQNYPIHNHTEFSDVPPWWVLKKKHKPLYTATGGGDWAKLFMAASTLTLKDTAEAAIIDKNFVDVMAYLKTIEVPKFPYTINDSLVKKGQNIFNSTCADCHGTYGENEFYPNLLISQDIVGTDAALVEAVQSESNSIKSFVDWFNTGWFGKNKPSGKLLKHDGYVAQPLDGIWASAPYLHNGSVPTLLELLKSDERNTYWRRTQNSAYDTEKIGWTYTVETSKKDKYTYDTTLRGYGNQGHTFGDMLTENERTALIEYLKTL